MPDHSSWLSVLNSGRWFSQLPSPLTQGLLGMARRLYRFTVAV